MALSIDHKNILQQLDNFKLIIQHLQQPHQSIKEPVQQITVVQQQSQEPVQEPVQKPVQEPVNQIIVVQPEIVIKKQLKTKSYVLRAAKNYREKHPDKLKEYREKYKKEKQEQSINLLPNNKLTKNQLIIKLQLYEDNQKNLNNKIKELEKQLINI